MCNIPSTSPTHTHTHTRARTHTHTQTDTHTAAVLEYLSEVCWLGLRLGTALPNHIAASKSSVYISNYTVARGVLEYSGRSPFHLCAASTPPHSHHHQQLFFLLLSSLLHPYLFISISLIFVVVTADCALSSRNHLPPDLRLLNSASQGTADCWGRPDRLWWSFHCPALICRGSQYYIHSGNVKDRSLAKDKK